ncbi:MAG: hypothetical protein OXF41_16480 [bacterium]|nr:hypothetical protein [bacterium]
MGLSELRHEYEREVIGPAVFAEIRKACASRAHRYPPTVYARSYSWDAQAIDELAQDVITDRLLGQHQLDYLFDVAESISDWRALLDRQVRITLARRRVRTVVDNLLDRAKRTLGSCETVEGSRVSEQTIYALRGEEGAYRPLTDQEVRGVVERIRVVPRRVPGQEDRAPAVYSKRNFKVLLRTVLRDAPGGITVRDLGRILELVLTDWVPAILEQIEGSVSVAVEDPGEAEFAREIAGHLVADWSSTEVTIVRGRLAGLTDMEVARQIDVSRPTLIKRRIALLDEIRTAAGDLSEAGQEVLVDELATCVMEREVSRG